MVLENKIDICVSDQLSLVSVFADYRLSVNGGWETTGLCQRREEPGNHVTPR